jgi:hypothetical protein
MLDAIISIILQTILSINHWRKQGKTVQQIGKSILIATVTSYTIISSFSLLLEFVVAIRIIAQNQNDWMVGNMNFLNETTFIPVVSFTAFLLLALFFGVMIIWKSIEPTLNRIINSTNPNNIANEQLADRINKLEKQIDEIKEKTK